MNIWGADIKSAAKEVATAIKSHADAQIVVAKINANSAARVAGQSLPYTQSEINR